MNETRTLAAMVQVSEEVDALLRPHCHRRGSAYPDTGNHALDAYRHLYDHTFVPRSFSYELIGKIWVISSFPLRSNDTERYLEFFIPCGEWLDREDWSEAERLADIPKFVTEYAGRRTNEETVAEFLRVAKVNFPEAYQRVLDKLKE